MCDSATSERIERARIAMQLPTGIVEVKWVARRRDDASQRISRRDDHKHVLVESEVVYLLNVFERFLPLGSRKVVEPPVAIEAQIENTHIRCSRDSRRQCAGNAFRENLSFPPRSDSHFQKSTSRGRGSRRIGEVGVSEYNTRGDHRAVVIVLGVRAVQSGDNCPTIWLQPLVLLRHSRIHHGNARQKSWILW